MKSTLQRMACRAALLALLPLAACAGQQATATAQTATPISPEVRTAFGPPGPYVLQDGDLLSVKFYYNPDLNEDVVVRPDGKISLQLIGDVQASGLTPAGLSAALAQRYAGELAMPKINVIVRQLGGNRIYVGGEVGKQGALPLSTGLTLFQAIQEAGGFTPTAHRAQVVLIRRVGEEPRGYSVDTRPIASGNHPEDDLALRPYDVVYVPRSKIADIDLFVEQYIRNVIPVQPSFIP